MPLVGYEKECDCPTEFTHPNGNGVVKDCVGVGHYATCPSAPIPRILAYALDLANAKTTRYGAERSISVTMLSRCPLQVYMETHRPYVEKILDSRWKLRGTFAHEGILSTVDSDDWLIEYPLAIPLTDVGVTVYGTLDAYYKPDCLLQDLKTQKEYAIDRKNKATDVELYKDPWVLINEKQLNCYRAMLWYGYAVDGDYNLTEGPLNLPVKRADLLYMDGGLRVRSLPVRLSDMEQELEWMKDRAEIMRAALDPDTDPTSLPPNKYKGFDPRKGSGTWDHIRSVLNAMGG